MGLDLNIEDKRFTLINVYGPNIDTPCFYDKLTEIIDFFGNQLCIICGDFNLVQNFNLDTHNYININNPRSREKILEIKEYKNLVDPFREIYPDVKRFTWRRKNPFKQSRLDFFLISESLIDDICEVNIGNSYRSDHSPVILTLKINEFIKGRGLWKFNNSLLQDPEYVKLIKQQITNTVEQYKMPVHRGDALHSIDNLDIDFSNNDQLLLETLLLEIRGKTISYSTFIKRERTKQIVKLTQRYKI